MIINERDIKNHADLYTDQIFHVKNAPVIKAKISRMVVDANRAFDEIEAEGRLQVDGLVVRITPDGKIIYKTPPSLKDIRSRIEKYHDTFHAELRKKIKETGAKFLIDGHSMWSRGPQLLIDAGVKRAEICLGNRDYLSCTPTQTDLIKHFFEDAGFTVAINIPYQGKYILGSYCHRSKLPGIQIEFNRSLYLNEKTLAPKKQMIRKLNILIEQLIEKITVEVTLAEDMGE